MHSDSSTLNGDAVSPHASSMQDTEKGRDVPKRSLFDRINPLSRSNPDPVPIDAGVCPEYDANFFSKLTWGWMTHLLWVGYTRPLQAGDIWHVEPDRHSSVLSKTLLDNFAKRKARGGKHPLFWALSDSHRWRFWSAGLMKVLSDTILTLNTIIIKHLIEYVGEAYYATRGGPAAPPIGRGIGLAFGLFLMQVASSILQHHFFYRSMLTGALSRGALIACIYKKSLVLSNKSRLEYTNGKITNLMSTDTFRIDFAAGYAHMLWTSMIQMIVILIILLINLGPSALAGYGLLVISAPVMSKIVQTLAKKRVLSTKYTDARVRLMQEILSSMRIIKFYAWENSFLDKVVKLRIAEMKIVQFLLITRSGVNAVSITIPVFATILAFVTYSLTGHDLAAGTIFSSLTLFNLLRMPLMFLPLVFSSITDASVALNRIQDMLSAEEIELSDSNQAEDDNAEKDAAIRIKMADFYWEGEDPAKKVKEAKADKTKTSRYSSMYNRITSRHPVSANTEKSKDSEDKDADAIAEDLEIQARAEKSSDSSSISVPDALGVQRDEKPADQADKSLQSAYTTGGPAALPEIKHTTEDTAARSSDVDIAHEAFSVRNLNFTIKKGELVAIVGTVGSGKSSILSALVGEMRKGQGSVDMHGSVGFCAQVPWIMNTTVKENILFGQPFDPVRYAEVVAAAALEPDFDILPQGDETEIGERGITISGGQKQRLNVARATYYDADIILLDDPLSAVDAHVGKHLFEKCILGVLGSKTRLLVTHQLNFLPQVDRILVVKDGAVVEQGSYQELVQRGQDFAQVLKEFGTQESEETEVDDDVLDDTDAKDKPAEKKVMSAKVVNVEDRETGAVSIAVYKNYFKTGGGLWTIPLLIFIIIVAQVSQVGNNLWLSFWSNSEFGDRGNGFYVGIYASFGFAQAFAYFALGFGITVIGNRASRGMHRAAVERVLRAPMSFFDTTPQGRIINRFSKDVDTMDNLLSDSFRMFLVTFASIIGSFILSIVIYHYFAAALGPLLVMFYLFALYYRASAREIKRIDSVLRSSVFAQFGETLTGLATVRAYGEQKRFIALNQEHIDRMNGAYLLTITNQRWLGIRLDFTGNLLILVIAILAVTSRFNVNPSTTGLVLSYTMQVVGMIGWMVRQFAEVENNMNASERVHHYGNKLDTEANFSSAQPPAPSWPDKGEIILRNVDMSYRPGLPLVLNNLNLQIHGGERIGIVGRTGAGKSSVLAALYRINELTGGSIMIDGIDISTIGLHELRSKLSIIPQDPILFAGTIRSNLDPNNQYDDHAIWQALLKSHFVSGEFGATSNTITLDSHVEDEGLNFSLGQRQLIAMSRALLRRSKILFLDEATSSIDSATDALIQTTIRTEFTNTTILTIAHRLVTIMNYDRILVMDQGSVLELGSPRELLRNDASQFSQMVKAANLRREDFHHLTED